MTRALGKLSRRSAIVSYKAISVDGFRRSTWRSTWRLMTHNSTALTASTVW